MNPPVILLDIDGILVDFTSKYLEVLDSQTGRTTYEHQITDFHFEKCICTKEEDARVWQYIEGSPGFVKNLPLHPGAIEFLEDLRDLGRVVACTSPANGKWAAERFEMLRDIGFAKMDIVITAAKELVEGEFLIDDATHNLESWSQRFPLGETILLNRPWNQRSENHFRAYGYEDVLEQIRSLMP